MRKAVITLLILLPLVLVVVIAIAGKIYGSVSAVLPTSVTLVDSSGEEADSLTISVGQTYQLSWVVSPDDATNTSVTFKSSNTSICTVSSSGAVTGSATGTATITVSTINNKTDKITVTVTSSGATGITIPTSTITAYVGSSMQITATADPAEETQYITWSSSNTDVVSITSVSTSSGSQSTGYGGYATLTFNSAGTATITATTSNGITKECEVIVKEAEVKFNEEMLDSTYYKVDSKTINLLDYLVDSNGDTITDISQYNIAFSVSGGSGSIEEDGYILTISESSSYVRVRLLYYNVDSDASCYVDVYFIYSGQ